MPLVVCEKMAMVLKSQLAEFREIVEQIHGTFLDSILGFCKVRKDAENYEEEIKKFITELQKSNPQYENIQLDSKSLSYSRVVKKGHQRRSTYLH